MFWPKPRLLLFFCAALDFLGLLALLAGIDLYKDRSLHTQWLWVICTAVAYLGLGWLFGSYTVLRWRGFPPVAVLQRVLITSLATLIVLALMRLAFNPVDTVWLVHRSSQAIWLPLLTLWSVTLRVLLRRGMLLPPPPKFVLVGSPAELRNVFSALHRTPMPHAPLCLSLEQAMQLDPPVVLAMEASSDQSVQRQALMQQLLERDPRETSFMTPLQLIERQLERLPPALVPDPWIDYQEIPWNGLFNLERQLKRVADFLVSAVLLITTIPLLLVAILLIWLEDRGPVFYCQRRSGWLGNIFYIYKLRTMSVSSSDSKAVWTKPGDVRITNVGLWLRRLRLDELPQLVNVLKGDMSLIGPRPERPEIENELEKRIPHYRKRHWMRPGLSGWAQVCAPYAASVEDSDLKLSYDLYYIKNFSFALDMMILVKTIKTILKASGR